MGQVGHADPKTTLRIYAHLLKRDRSGVAKALDELIHGAQPRRLPRFTATAEARRLPAKPLFLGQRMGQRAPIDPKRAELDIQRDQINRAFAGTFRMGAAGFEPATSRV